MRTRKNESERERVKKEEDNGERYKRDKIKFALSHVKSSRIKVRLCNLLLIA